MEARKITVVQTKNQKKSVVMTNATTLGALKEALDEAGIDYGGMTFYEGLSKTELKHDDAILPHDIERNGTVTNELVFMLTNTDKKIRSGLMSRPELYSYIKSNNLQSEVQKKLGKNFTMCKTADLQSIVDKHMKGNKAKPVVTEKPIIKETPKVEAKPESKVEVKEEAPVTEGRMLQSKNKKEAPVASQDNNNIKIVLADVIEILYQGDIIENNEDKERLLNLLKEDSESSTSNTSTVNDDMSSPYSDAEIRAMMRNM